MTSLQRLAQVANDVEPALMPFELAKALDWSSLQPKVIQVGNGRAHGFAARGYHGAEPAAVFVGSSEPDPAQLLPDSAFFAYHASIQWGIIAGRHEAIVFNSHWVLGDGWYSLPTIAWDSPNTGTEIIKALTPTGITQGEIEQVALEYKRPDAFLVSVDDALVERLDHWRDEALRYARDPTDIDEKLQTLFAQLFVLRAVEDRNLAPGLKTLNSIYALPVASALRSLRRLFREAKARIQSDLFDSANLDTLPWPVVSGVISDLYSPHHLPHATSLRYNFAWIDADILGRAYEKYLSTLLLPAAPPPQLQLWQQPERGVARLSVQKTRGVYYTPPSLVRFLAEQCLHSLSTPSTEARIPRVLDFSCGSGSFLVAAADNLLRRLKETDSQRNWASEVIEGKKIIGGLRGIVWAG